MQIHDNGQTYNFIPTKEFRETYSLPTSFGIAQFEPKDFSGLGAIDKAGSAMNELQNALINAVPDPIKLPELLTLVDTLRELFRSGLHGINDIIKLKIEEVEFAVSGFSDVLTAWAYKLVQTRGAGADFKAVYNAWLHDSIRVSQNKYSYDHNGNTWQIQTVNYAYGRLGLRVQIDDSLYYVQDRVYACPAHGYMLTLMKDIALQMHNNLAQ